MFNIKPIGNHSNPRYKNVYSYIFEFEDKFCSNQYVGSWVDWMKQNWTLSIVSSIIYTILILGIKHYMKSRAKFELRQPLIVWNIFLAAFSFWGTLRVWPDFLYSLTNEGFIHTVCDNQGYYGITGFWALLFTMSKLPELVDTFFIVLRKQELIFLHWYHHTTVLMYVWYSYKDMQATGYWFMSMNYLIHTIMYSYYAFKAMRFNVPRIVAQLITAGQLIQMIVGCYISYIAWQMQHNSQLIKCHNTPENVFYSSLMYLSYFILFANFFINSYVLKKSAKVKGANETLKVDTEIEKITKKKKS